MNNNTDSIANTASGQGIPDDCDDAIPAELTTQQPAPTGESELAALADELEQRTAEDEEIDLPAQTAFKKDDSPTIDLTELLGIGGESGVESSDFTEESECGQVGESRTGVAEDGTVTVTSEPSVKDYCKCAGELKKVFDIGGRWYHKLLTLLVIFIYFVTIVFGVIGFYDNNQGFTTWYIMLLIFYAAGAAMLINLYVRSLRIGRKKANQWLERSYINYFGESMARGEYSFGEKGFTFRRTRWLTVTAYETLARVVENRDGLTLIEHGGYIHCIPSSAFDAQTAYALTELLCRKVKKFVRHERMVVSKDSDIEPWPVRTVKFDCSCPDILTYTFEPTAKELRKAAKKLDLFRHYDVFVWEISAFSLALAAVVRLFYNDFRFNYVIGTLLLLSAVSLVLGILLKRLPNRRLDRMYGGKMTLRFGKTSMSMTRTGGSSVMLDYKEIKTIKIHKSGIYLETKTMQPIFIPVELLKMSDAMNDELINRLIGWI